MAKETKKTDENKKKIVKSASKKISKTVTKKDSIKKVSAKKVTSKKANKKVTSKATISSGAKKNNNSKSSIKKTPSKKISSSKKIVSSTLEYYDLPYRYDQTLVKVLAQTPTILFVYWDISDKDKDNFINTFGSEFFNKTRPVLLVHNETKNYTFEVEVDDFANGWYLHVGDTSCKYYIELGRRTKSEDFSIPDNYLYITSSNVVETPNNHILFEHNSNMIYFRNVKTGEVSSKEIANFEFIRNMGKIYHIYDLYSKIYKNDPNNPGSSNPTSGRSNKLIYKIIRII